MIAGFYLLIALGIDFFFIEPKLIHYPFNMVGIIVVFASMILIMWAILIFKKNETTLLHHDKPSVLVTSGPYRFSRNPIYLGLSLGTLGIAIFIGTIAVFFAPLAFALTINWAYIPQEEKKLEQIFGKTFTDYKNHVRRWL